MTLWYPPTPTRREGIGGQRPPAGGWGNPVSPYPTRREGRGGQRPPRNNLLRRGIARHAHTLQNLQSKIYNPITL